MSQDDFNVLPQVLLKHSGQGGGYPEGLVRPRTTDSREPRSRQIINEKREKTGILHSIFQLCDVVVSLRFVIVGMMLPQCHSRWSKNVIYVIELLHCFTSHV